MSDYDLLAFRSIAAPEEERAEAEFRELQAFVQSHLERPVEEAMTRVLFEVQSKLRDLQSFLVFEMDRSAISPESYLERFDDLMKASMLECRAVLGSTDFKLVYGETGTECEGLVDRDQFLTEESARRDVSRFSA